MMKDNRGTRRFQVSRAMVLLLAVLAAFFLLQGGGFSSAASGSGESPNASAVSPDTNCPANGQCFADVLPNNVFFNFVNRIYQQDLVTGYPCGGPGEPCDAES